MSESTATDKGCREKHSGTPMSISSPWPLQSGWLVHTYVMKLKSVNHIYMCLGPAQPADVWGMHVACPNVYTLASAAKSSWSSRPCTNRPLKCPICNAVIQSYSMEDH